MDVLYLLLTFALFALTLGMIRMFSRI